MENNKTSVFSNGLIWFGAAVSIAEILTGSLIAPLGFKKGIIAIVLGHFIGCCLLYMAGLIGANTGKSSMETVKMSFGQKGSIIFSSINIIQLIGWTAVMIISGAMAANVLLPNISISIWSIIISILVIIWVILGVKSLEKINTIAMGLLFIVTIILSFVLFKDSNHSILTSGNMTFGSALELSIAMPLSWLPLISDYTKSAKEPKKSTFISVLVYFIVSCWMYLIGLGATIITGESDIAMIMLKANLGIAAIIIIVFSTVTTTYLDVFSAGISSVSIKKNLNPKLVSIIVCIIGLVLVLFTPITQYENFLYFISSVFAPMISIQIVDFFYLKKDNSINNFDYLNLGLWFLGFIIYRIFLKIDTPIGNTLPVMIISAFITIVAAKIKNLKAIKA
ncbi:MAG: putative hydroxymethylpyrimidine transporter CytX [Tissierellia bacterium]|nr:putative hydroxymethylpyrimidine transporter CytX [Tissierellia bacterium]